MHEFILPAADGFIATDARIFLPAAGGFIATDARIYFACGGWVLRSLIRSKK
jgi:hypothetical protein